MPSFKDISARLRTTRPGRFIACLKEKTCKRQFGGLEQLPNELLLMIAKDLPLHSQILLSQTCRQIRLLLVTDCIVVKGRLYTYQRIELLHNLHDDLKTADGYICMECHEVHRMDPNDTPRLDPGTAVRKSCPKFSLPMFPVKGPYHVSQRHVQLALRLHRKQIEPERLANLLKPFATGPIVPGQPENHHYAEPAIVNGRFMLYSQYIYSLNGFGPLGHQYTHALMHKNLTLCPHLNFFSDDSSFNIAPNILESAIWSLEGFGDWNEGSCPGCRTDFRVYACVDRVMVEAWRDFGESGWINDGVCKVQVERKWPLTPFAAWEPWMGREAGGVERMWRKARRSAFED